MRTTILLWDEDSLQQDLELQQQVSDIAYRIVLSAASPVRRTTGRGTPASLTSELNDLAAKAVRELKALPRGSSITNARVQDLNLGAGNRLSARLTVHTTKGIFDEVLTI